MNEAAGASSPAGEAQSRQWRAAVRAGLRCLRRGVGWGLFGLVVIAGLLLPRTDSLRPAPAEAAAVGYRYGLISWEFANFPAKWLHRIYTAMPWTDTSLERRQAELDRYLELTKELRDAQGQLDAASARASPGVLSIAAAQSRVDALIAERNSIRDGVEEYLESVLSQVIIEQKINALGGFIWPPVDFRLDDTPNVLVTSPRDRVERLDTVLIEPDIPVEAMERIEAGLHEREGLSAIVEPTGGLATYPTVITSDRELLSLLDVAAHEWLHSYLFFHGLGQSYDKNADMTTLNETFADMAGRELGGLAYTKLTGQPAPPIEPPRTVERQPPKPGEFDFFTFMRETRLRTEELLKGGDIEGAERYMEERRQELNSYGYRIRKINQAYFAFHGSYGESASSVSPIAQELYDLRQLSPSVGDFVGLVRGVTSYERFKEILEEKRAQARDA